MIILLLAAQAAAIPPAIEAPSARIVPPPPVVIAPSGGHLRSDLLSAATRERIEAYDRQVGEMRTAASTQQYAAMSAWRAALDSRPIDAAALRRAARDLDTIAQRGPAMAGWADIYLSLDAAEQAVLADALRYGSGRLPASRALRTEAEKAADALTARANAAIDKIERSAREKDRDRWSREAEIRALRRQAGEIAAARPFDVAALRRALAAIEAKQVANQRIQRDLNVDAFAALSADERDAVLATLPGVIGVSAVSRP